jgi:competence protein ComEA
MVGSLGILKETIAVGFMSVVMLAALVPNTRSGPVRQVENERKPEPIDWSVFLPDGEGKSVVMLSCTSCHDLRQVITQKKSESGWKTSVQKMIAMYKAPIDKDDLPTLTEYLSRHFGKTNPIEQLPMDINSASAESLARLPAISADLAKVIVETREKKGPFDSVEDLSRVHGVEGSVVKRIRSYVIAVHR